MMISVKEEHTQDFFGNIRAEVVAKLTTLQATFSTKKTGAE